MFCPEPCCDLPSNFFSAQLYVLFLEGRLGRGCRQGWGLPFVSRSCWCVPGSHAPVGGVSASSGQLLRGVWIGEDGLWTCLSALTFRLYKGVIAGRGNGIANCIQNCFMGMELGVGGVGECSALHAKQRVGRDILLSPTWKDYTLPILTRSFPHNHLGWSFC